MLNLWEQFARAAEVNSKLWRLYQTRAKVARDHFTERTGDAFQQHLKPFVSDPASVWKASTGFWGGYYAYAIDAAQRSILFWDTLRKRGNQFLEREQAGTPPVLHFDYETVLDARKFERPVNYALLRILPPEGVTIDPKRRPYIIIDPRAGHGPGIGGFKDDSQVGVAIRDGHPVYFVIFFPDPEPGQTLLDVTAAEQQFVHKVRDLHPQSPKPVLIGNCQGGWAAMMLAACEPDVTGPIVINGAPMSYWGGAWSEGEGDNPMRYAAGLLGGTWPASFASDLGNGKFDGAWLVQNFENLNPANTFWDKYYHLYANVDSESPRFLDFERWWGGFFLMNREEIEWITRNLFVGNKLWSTNGHESGAEAAEAFDLRNIKSPIILFASLGDNITPPQQAFNWVADVYRSTDEIKARGQVIVGLLHRDVGHLGIFVSGRVAKKEHRQIVSVLKSIEALPPGLYGMQILERKSSGDKIEYDVQFVEHRLEDITKRLNRFERADEKPFEAVEKIAEFQQHAYDLFARPLVQAFSNNVTAEISRKFHPLRWQRWAVSDLNPWLAWIGPAAEAVKARRQPLDKDAFARRLERMTSELISASLEFYRELRDAASEVMFYEIYGNLFSFGIAGQRPTEAKARQEAGESSLTREAFDAIAKGGYAEAVARVFALLARPGVAFPLAQLHLKQELIERFRDLLPNIPRDEQRRIRGMQDLIVRRDREGALAALPHLVEDRADRERLRMLLERVMADEGVRRLQLAPEQIQMLQRILRLLDETDPVAAPRVRAKGSPFCSRRRKTVGKNSANMASRGIKASEATRPT